MSPSWTSLSDALKNLAPVGPSGFEGLVADLLRAHLSQPFFLARTGDQPSGDVYCPPNGIVVQVKRYNATNFNENEIIGEVDRAIAAVAHLDLYVLVATKPLGQLAARLEDFAGRAGIDVIPITLSDGVSDLGALCVSHWQNIRNYFPLFDESWVKWSADRAIEPLVTSHLSALEASFKSAHSRDVLAKKCLNALSNRFSKDEALDGAVSRESIRLGLEKWWNSDGPPIAVLEGEEGAGKSWAAACFAFDVAKSAGGVAFWLDSNSWTDAKSPERVLELCLENVMPGDEALRTRIKRKLLRQWSSPMLVVLDGANERSAYDAAESLVKSYRFHPDDPFHQRVRLLFTTRPLTARSSTFQQLWVGYARIEAVPFSDVELEQALKALGGQVQAKDLPASVIDLARIPRYLKLCVQLRKELESFSHLTKELLLWVDLRSKVAKSDPQIRTIETTIAASPEELLSGLATKCGWPTSDSLSIAKNDVREIFPNFESVRSDLIEQRIVLKNSTPATFEISGSHVILGWALWLRQLSDRKPDAKREYLREELLKELEPAASNDLKAKALHVASLLSFFDSSQTSVSQTKSILLELWIRHHNAILVDDSLQYFVDRDLSAFAFAVEGLFIHHFRGYLETQLTLPLVRIWRDDLPQRGELRTILERWLTLVYPGGREGSRDRDIDPPDRFPVATSPEQLRLAYVAISIISFRPDMSLLPTLIDSYLSQDFCITDVESGNAAHRIPLKWCCEPLGYLMRWNYGELAIPGLVMIAAESSSTDLEKENLGWFARLFRQASLPAELGAAQDISSGGDISPQEDIGNLEAWLSRTPTPGRKLIGFGSLAAWATRLDVPPLSNSGIAELKNEMHLRASEPGQAVYGGTWENREFEDLIPWAAKLIPETLGFCRANSRNSGVSQASLIVGRSPLGLRAGARKSSTNLSHNPQARATVSFTLSLRLRSAISIVCQNSPLLNPHWARRNSSCWPAIS